MVKVREAFQNEIQTIARLQEYLALETEGLKLDTTIVREGVEAVFKDSSKGAYYMAEKDKAIAGTMLTTYEWSDWRNCDFIWIQSLYILPEFRNSGIFKTMYGYVQDIVLQSPAYGGIRLYVDKNNHDAQKVYMKLGMSADHYQLFEWIK